AEFIPRRKLIQIVNKNSIKKELTNIEPATPSSPDQVHAYQTPGAPRKPESFRKIMAILVLIGKPSKIRLFLEEGVSDADLPLFKQHIPNSSMPRWELRGARGDPKKIIRCFHGWKHRALSEFERRQWRVLTAFFALGARKEVTTGGHGYGKCPRIINHWVLGDSVVLPFISQEEFGSPGGCGQVMKVKIHPDHHAFNPLYSSNPNVFAVKRLKSKKREDFDREISMLKRISGDFEHGHLIVLSATYKHRGFYHLIFPWADADLVGYWEGIEPSPDRSITRARWLARQCRGLADALATIHRFPTFTNDSLLAGASPTSPNISRPRPKPNAPRKEATRKILFGFHRDIKPPNILWFPGGSKSSDDLGTLKITDFGIAEFTRDGTSSRQQLGNSPPYRAPEVDVPDAILGPSYDIWALGCVYLEFVAWYLRGWKGVQHFETERSTLDSHRAYRGIKTPTFFTVDKSTNSPKPVVKEEVVKPLRRP
ncbi:kinase-like domain-containing protein, partial [Lasiosphaeria hispida]